MSCTTILPDTEVGVFRLYQPSTYDKFYTRVYGETESRISLDVMLDVEIEHHIISISLTPGAVYSASIDKEILPPILPFFAVVKASALSSLLA